LRFYKLSFQKSFLLILNLLCSFSGWLRYKVKLFILNLSFSQCCHLLLKTSPLKLLFAASLKFSTVVFVWSYFFTPFWFLICPLVSQSVLCNFYTFMVIIAYFIFISFKLISLMLFAFYADSTTYIIILFVH
jgi:hypothetical protein